LEHIFVQTREGALLPEVLFVDVFGRDVKTSAPLRERLKP